MKRTATAIALATILVAAGLSVAPPAAADANCDQDYTIANSEPADADARVLLPGTSEVGPETVSASQGNETLMSSS